MEVEEESGWEVKVECKGEKGEESEGGGRGRGGDGMLGMEK